LPPTDVEGFTEILTREKTLQTLPKSSKSFIIMGAAAPPRANAIRTLETLLSSTPLIDPRNPPRHQGVGVCTPLWTGILTAAQLTLSRHYWVVI